MSFAYNAGKFIRFAAHNAANGIGFVATKAKDTAVEFGHGISEKPRAKRKARSNKAAPNKAASLKAPTSRKANVAAPRRDRRN